MARGVALAGGVEMKIQALLVCLSCASPAAYGEVLFRAGFETGDLSEWSSTGTRSQNATARNVQVVGDVAHEGKYAVKVTIHEDDVFNARQLRAQLGGPRVTVEEGSDTYLSFSIYMAEPPQDRDNFFYWEGTPPPRYNNVMTWWVEPGETGGTRIRYGTGNLGRNGTEWDAEFSIGKWHRLAMHIHWSEDAERGNTRLWFDGALVLDKKLKTKGPESVYFCQPGIHRSPHRRSVDSIYFDDFILATTLDEVLQKR
ncbi:MAG: heparin lyase I family protein [Bryobacteraceae bacterium]